jgi:hypothetical protein
VALKKYSREFAAIQGIYPHDDKEKDGRENWMTSETSLPLYA